jgi:hypothetical protein
VLCLYLPQVSGQAAMECIPLVMEPRSRFYTSPVVVLDFQVRPAATAHALPICILKLCIALNAHAATSLTLWPVAASRRHGACTSLSFVYCVAERYTLCLIDIAHRALSVHALF